MIKIRISLNQLEEVGPYVEFWGSKKVYRTLLFISNLFDERQGYSGFIVTKLEETEYHE